MNNTTGFYFAGHEPLLGRAGINLRYEHIKPSDILQAMREIEYIYKRKFGYECVKVIRNKNDPLLVDVYVIPTKLYAHNYYTPYNCM